MLLNKNKTKIVNLKLLSRAGNLASQTESNNASKYRPVNAYILGAAVESENAPIFHDPGFVLSENEKKNAGFKEQLGEAQSLNKNPQILAQEKNDLETLFKRREEEKLREIERLQQKQSNFKKQQQEILLRVQERERIAREKREENEKLMAQRILALENQRQQKIKQQTLIEEQRQQLKRQQKLQFAEKQRLEQEKLLAERQLDQQRLAQKEKQQTQYDAWLKAQKLNQGKKQNKKPLINLGKKSSSLTGGLGFKGLFLNSLLQFSHRSALGGFLILAILLSMSIGAISYASKGFGLKGRVLGASTEGFANLTTAMSDMAHQNFEDSSNQFDQAYANFSQARGQLEEMGDILIDATQFVPFASKLSSGKNAVEAGRHFSAAGKSLNEVVKVTSQLKNPIDAQSNASLLDVFRTAEKNVAEAKTELDAAQQNLDHISVDDLPKDKQDKFILLKQKLPEIRSTFELFLNNSHIFVELLGGNGPRKYLFLFQNNSEMRATGGFIGSYGLLDIANGQVKKFFIDGIFNPDGQLRDKIVPPEQIQKISAAWSMHDSNWFADFPSSAQKSIQFYEKTGGPTADGVITFTPTVMEKLLEITGPIEMPEYGVTLDAKNFIELTQFKVEVDYDKAENKPKKILSDLAPLILDKLLKSKDISTISRTAEAFLTGLREKHILFYSQNKELEQIIANQGWSGEILPAGKDYLAVINSNINGFKTDAVIDEKIEHKAEIQADGSIIDTVSISRKHNGGSTNYEWLNKVNADYMRVYVPEGSKLLEVSGQTREVDNPPLDYDALGFKRDSDVQNLESTETIDPESGTHIYSESGKTVFANWTYVSPQETMTITYKYLLPFRMFQVLVNKQTPVDSYSLVAQKQSGSAGSEFSSTINYPQDYDLKWNFPDNVIKNDGSLKMESKLNTDRFTGALFQQK